MTDFENIISFENLYKAHRRARLGKRHKKEVILFEADLSKNLWALHYDLKYGRYQVGDYHKFMIYDPKEREIQAISYRDRIIQHSICDNYLMPLLNKHLIYDNAACRKDKGTSFAIKRLRKFLSEHYKKHKSVGYFVKIDVSKYFPSIDHEVLKAKVEKIVKERAVFELLYRIIDSYTNSSGKGLPMGNQSSQCFALLYLNDFDKFFKEKIGIKHYIRYMDDIIMLTNDKNQAKECLKNSEKILNAVNLNMNPKSQILSLKNGINFIGWSFSYGKNGKIIQKASRQTKKRIIKKVKRIANFPKKTEKSLISYQGYLMQGMNFYFLEKVKKLLIKS